MGTGGKSRPSVNENEQFGPRDTSPVVKWNESHLLQEKWPGALQCQISLKVTEGRNSSVIS